MINILLRMLVTIMEDKVEAIVHTMISTWYFSTWSFGPLPIWSFGPLPTWSFAQMPIWTFGPLPSLSQLGLLQPGATLHTLQHCHTLQCIVFILALLYVSAPSVRPNICHVFWPGRRRQCLGLCLTLAQLVPPSSTNTIRDTNTQL